MITFDFLCSAIRDRGLKQNQIVDDMIRAVSSVGAKRYIDVNDAKLHFERVSEAVRLFNDEVQKLI